jgi:YtoQ family protein
MKWKIYLSGEIHSDWRNRIINATKEAQLEVEFYSPVTNHSNSDECGVKILGEEENPFWKDRKGAGINAIRTRSLINSAHMVVVRFGEQYRQWNAAFDAGYAAALGKPLIIIHDDNLTHALKEVDEAAMAVAKTPEQVVEIIQYVVSQ